MSVCVCSERERESQLTASVDAPRQNGLHVEATRHQLAKAVHGGGFVMCVAVLLAERNAWGSERRPPDWSALEAVVKARKRYEEQRGGDANKDRADGRRQ